MHPSADDVADHGVQAARAAELARRLEAPGSPPVAALRWAEELKDLADGLLAGTAGRAHAEGLSWQEIGYQLGISRQAAFQRFSAGTGTRTGPARGRDALVARAQEVFGALAAGRFPEVAADFTARMADQVSVSDLAGVWASCVESLGAYEQLTAATVRHNGTMRVVHCSLVFAGGVMDGRLGVEGSGRISGLLITDPGFGPPASD